MDEADRRTGSPPAETGPAWAGRVFELAWKAGQDFASSGWAGLPDDQAGALALVTRSVMLQRAFSRQAEEKALTGPRFALMMLSQTGGIGCRMEVPAFREGRSALRLVVSPVDRDIAWDDLPDIATLRNARPPGPERMDLSNPVGEKGKWRTRALQELVSCQDVAGVDPRRFGEATRALRRGFRMDAADGILMLGAVLQIAEKLRYRRAGSFHATLRQVRLGDLEIPSVRAVAWHGGGPVPDPGIGDEEGHPLSPEDLDRPGVRILSERIHAVRDEDGETRIVGGAAIGRVVN